MTPRKNLWLQSMATFLLKPSHYFHVQLPNSNCLEKTSPHQWSDFNHQILSHPGQNPWETLRSRQPFRIIKLRVIDGITPVLVIARASKSFFPQQITFPPCQMKRRNVKFNIDIHKCNSLVILGTVRDKIAPIWPPFPALYFPPRQITSKKGWSFIKCFS